MTKSFDKSVYNERYYEIGFGPVPYDREAEGGIWLEFFGNIASNIVARYSPKRVLDLGCAKGFLVESLRDRGVNAFGVDISDVAISEVREDIRPYCKVASIEDESVYEGQYDLITCIEVLEHVTEDMAENAIKFMCRHSKQILFSSSPTDFDEPTHINVKPPDYWDNLFSKYGFKKTEESWQKIVAKHAVIYRSVELEELRKIKQTLDQLTELKDGFSRLAILEEQSSRIQECLESMDKIESQNLKMQNKMESIDSVQKELESEIRKLQPIVKRIEDVHKEFKTLSSIQEQNKLLQDQNKLLEEQNQLVMQQNQQIIANNRELISMLYVSSKFPSLERKIESILQEHSMVENIMDLKNLLENVEKYQDTIDQKDQIIADKDRHIINIENHLNAIQSTKGWRTLEKLRRVRNFIKKNKFRSVPKVANKVKERGVSDTIKLIDEKLTESVTSTNYDEWYREHVPSDSDIENMRLEITNFNYYPLISIVVPTYNIDEQLLRKAVESVQNQVYEKWELCICDDCSPNERVWEVLNEYAKKDSRIKIVRSDKNLGIAGATNKAIELSKGDYVGFLDHDDELTVDALFEVAKKINETRADLIYSDEDKLELDGTYCDPFFKPDYSPDYLLSTNYICHFAVYKKTIGDNIGWINSGFDGAQDYDFVLRFTEKAKRVEHIPKILYHWRKIPGSTAESFGAKSYAQDAGHKAVEEALKRRGIKGEAFTTIRPGHYRVKRDIKGEPLVSIIIPTKDKIDLLMTCINSIRSKTTYKNYEIIVVDNNSEQQETFDYYRKMSGRIRVLKYNKPFNYSAINNYAVTKSKGEYLLFLNNDTEVVESNWIESMLEHAQRNEVGAVGAKLLFPNNTVQHAGVILGVGGVANHACLHLSKDADGYFGMLHDTRNVSAVTGACLMMRREVFDKIGGFNEKNLPVGFNDVDLCLNVRDKGYLCIWTPYAVLYHYESATRSREVDPSEVEYMRKTWAKILDNDPYYNKNFDRNEVVNSYCKLKW